MSSVTLNSERGTFPIGYLIVITALLVAVFAVMAPRPQRIVVVEEPVAVADASLSEPASAAAMPTPADHRMLMALGLEEVNESAVKKGQRTYNAVCAACHGFDARGIRGLGKTLIASNFVDSMHDNELVAFIITGRTINDPANTTGVAMPGKGGSPGLSEQDIHDLVDFIRSLNGATIIKDLPEATPVELRAFTPLNFNSISAGGSSEATATPEPTLVPTSAPSEAAPAEASPESSSSGFAPINFNSLDPNVVNPSGSGANSASESAPAEATPEASPSDSGSGFAPINFNALDPNVVSPSGGSSNDASSAEATPTPGQ